MLAELAAHLSHDFDRAEAHALVALALDFWTWQRLDREGLDDAAAAALMTGLLAGPADRSGSRRATAPRKHPS